MNHKMNEKTNGNDGPSRFRIQELMANLVDRMQFGSLQEGRLLSSYAHAGDANLRGTISGKQCCCGNETELPKRDFFWREFFTFPGSSKSPAAL